MKTFLTICKNICSFITSVTILIISRLLALIIEVSTMLLDTIKTNDSGIDA